MCLKISCLLMILPVIFTQAQYAGSTYGSGYNRGQPQNGQGTSSGSSISNWPYQQGRCGPHSMIPIACREFVEKVTTQYSNMIQDYNSRRGDMPEFMKTEKCRNGQLDDDCCSEGMKEAVAKVRMEGINMYQCKQELDVFFPSSN